MRSISFSSSSRVDYHKRIVGFSCDECGDWFSNKEIHIVFDSDFPTDPILYLCDACYKEFVISHKPPDDAEKQFSVLVKEFSERIRSIPNSE